MKDQVCKGGAMMKNVHGKRSREKSIIPVILWGIILLGGYVSTVSADEAGEAKLLKKIETLEKRIQVLESGQPSTAPSLVTRTDVEAIVSEKVAQAKQEGGFQLPAALQGITMSGFVDTTYVYNTNRPDAGTNTGRVFDTEANSFGVQAAKLAFEKLPEKTGGVGFRMDMLIGQDAKVLNNGTNGFVDDGHFDLEQAYIDVMAPLGKGLDIKAGKFVTLHGAEVIESKDNWNVSRSFLFGYAIPFTHTGVRASYPISDTLTGYFGINNGWDDVKDNNKSKSVESSLAWTPKDWISFNLAGMYGPEQAGNNHSNRALVDFVTTYKPFEKLTFRLNADYAADEDAVAAGEDGFWSGVAGYVRYDFNDKWSLSNRVEYFSDPKGLRVVAGTNEDLWENTVTLELRPYKNLITRLEYRYDQSTAQIYTLNSKSTDHQSTIGVEAIYTF